MLMPRYNRESIERTVSELCWNSGILGGFSYNRRDVLAMRDDEADFAIRELKRLRNREVGYLNQILRAKK